MRSAQASEGSSAVKAGGRFGHRVVKFSPEGKVLMTLGEAGVPGSDTDFARDLLAQYNVTVLPGSYLARGTGGLNPGAQRVRMALVAGTAECVEAAQRIVQFVKNRSK